MIKSIRFETRHHASIAKAFARMFLCLYSTPLFAVDVEISKFDAVPTNVLTDIIVVLAPSSVTNKEVYLNLRSLEGNGKAVFLPGNHTSTNVSETSTLQIIGKQLSSVEGNMVLEAKIKEMAVASNIFTVVATGMASEGRAIKPTVVMNKEKVEDKEEMITKSQAIEIARAAIRGRVKTYEGAPITVELKDRDYIVTFGWLPPKGAKGGPIMGPSYAARVTLDAYTGSVKNGIQRSE